MSREIKFRAWDKLSSQMFSVRGLMNMSSPTRRSALIVGRAPVSSGNGPAWYTKVPTEKLVGDRFELMQYTGLKDKNGVEIYEGDVVRYQYPQKRLANHQQLCTVIYEPKAAAFLLKARYFEPQVKYLGDIAKSNMQYDTRTYELCEVIGNIYENPELIEHAPA